jgi:hypothetical protein
MAAASLLEEARILTSHLTLADLRRHDQMTLSIEELEAVFESCGEDTLRDCVEILIAENRALREALKYLRALALPGGPIQVVIDAALAAEPTSDEANTNLSSRSDSMPNTGDAPLDGAQAGPAWESADKAQGAP